MEEKLDALSDAIDFIKLAKQEIEEYKDLNEISDELDDLKSKLSEKYEETRDRILDKSDNLSYEY